MPDDAQQQRHAAGDRQHHQRERAARHRRVDRPPPCVRTRASGRFGFTDQTACRISFIKLAEPAAVCGSRRRRRAARWLHCPRSSSSAAASRRSSAPSGRRRRRRTSADHADDLAPVDPSCASRMRLPSAAAGSCHSSRAMFSETMATGRLIVDIGPGEIAAGDQAVAHGLEEARRDELEAPQRRNLPFGVQDDPRRRSDRCCCCRPWASSSSQRDRRDARNRRDPVDDLLLACGRRCSGSFDLGLRDGDAQRLHIRPVA